MVSMMSNFVAYVGSEIVVLVCYAIQELGRPGDRSLLRFSIYTMHDLSTILYVPGIHMKIALRHTASPPAVLA